MYENAVIVDIRRDYTEAPLDRLMIVAVLTPII